MTAEPRRFQFGLKKLFLWTAVISLYLGFLSMVELGPIIAAQLTAFVVVIVILRSTVGWQFTVIASLAGCSMGPVLFGVVELTFRAVNWADSRMQTGEVTSDETIPRTGGPVKYGFAAGALLVAMLGSIVPLGAIIDLWQVPVGSGVRPMGLPIIMLWNGLGTPIVAITFVVLAFKSTKDTSEPAWKRAMVRSLAILAAVAAFAPLFITILGARWVIDTHSLWVKP